MEVKLSYDPVSPSFGRSVCSKGRKVSLSGSLRSTSFNLWRSTNPLTCRGRNNPRLRVSSLPREVIQPQTLSLSLSLVWLSQILFFRRNQHHKQSSPFSLALHSFTRTQQSKLTRVNALVFYCTKTGLWPRCVASVCATGPGRVKLNWSCCCHSLS